MLLRAGCAPRPKPRRHRLLAVRRVVAPDQLVVLVGLGPRLIGEGELLHGHRRRLRRGLAVGGKLGGDREPSLAGLPAHAHHAPRVWEPPPVHLAAHQAEAPHPRVGHALLHDVVEHRASRAGDVAQILVSPRRLVDLAHWPRVIFMPLSFSGPSAPRNTLRCPVGT